ncbi:dynamin family protein [Aerosakkonemataceae cyanobacterium BLCC-F154]|uniref:Dynamin family protein n=1 Tax=Floridaenema fluviatile BLCC-F154 TaxID=3153640 RepID=A0ABV4YFP0_9CYAN
MLTLRATQIAKIIANRKSYAHKIEAEIEKLSFYENVLGDLQDYSNQLLEQTVDDSILLPLEELAKIDIPALLTEIESELKGLEKLKKRFSRDTLNIGVVGKAREGKSTLLRSISGLSSEEIPTSDRQHCTGVKVIIRHGNSLEYLSNAETYGEIWFYTEDSFLNDIIGLYYEELGLGDRPFTLDEFAKPGSLPELPNHLKNISEFESKYKKLQEYQKNLKQYRHLLNAYSPRLICKSDIREYVAQHNSVGEPIYNYVAVKEARVTCSFPQSDVGQIALVDMPGLGDTTVGDEQKLIKALGEDVDFVLFMRLPNPTGAYWDIENHIGLYDKVRSALVELPIEKWSFMILNRIVGQSPVNDNLKNCEYLQHTINDVNIKVVDCVIANCQSTEEVNNKILDPILDYLTNYLTLLDQEYASARRLSINRLRKQIQDLIKKSEIVFGQVGLRDVWFPVFISLFNNLWNNLSTSLESLLDSLAVERDIPNAEISELVNNIVQNCQNNPGVPSIAEIEKLRASLGGYQAAYNICLNNVRTYISQQFLSIDKGLKLYVEEVKFKVAKVLAEQGYLGKLIPEEFQGAELIEKIANNFSKSENKILGSQKLQNIKLGFEILADFNLSYREVMQHRIRKQLDRLMPDKAPQLTQPFGAQQIYNFIKTLYDEVLYDCKQALSELINEPGQAAYAIVEEFVDRILRAEGVKDEWLIFLQLERTTIWSSEFQALTENSHLHHKWLGLVKRIEEAVKLEPGF